jgi:hypothetical protein
MHPEVQYKIREESKSCLVKLLDYVPFQEARKEGKIFTSDLLFLAVYVSSRNFRMECYWEISGKTSLEGEKLNIVRLQNEEEAKKLTSELYDCSIEDVSDRLHRIDKQTASYIEEYRKNKI